MTTGRYSSEEVHRLRMPEIDGKPGAWKSTWQLQIAEFVVSNRLEAVASAVLAHCGGAVDLRWQDDKDLRMVLESVDHPLDVDAFEFIDCVLRTIDAELNIKEINGSPRDWWRTFRSVRASVDPSCQE